MSDHAAFLQGQRRETVTLTKGVNPHPGVFPVLLPEGQSPKTGKELTFAFCEEYLFPRTAHRNANLKKSTPLSDATFFPRILHKGAKPLERARKTARFSRKADQRPEIHQGLVEMTSLSGRHMGNEEVAYLTEVRTLFSTENPREHTPHIGVKCKYRQIVPDA